MNKEDLPETLYAPVVSLDQGTICAQLKDGSGNRVVIAWGNEEKLVLWIKEGGYDLWCHHNKTNYPKERIATQEIDRSMLLLMARNGELHYEPEIGNLFAPPSRRVKVSSDEFQV